MLSEDSSPEPSLATSTSRAASEDGSGSVHLLPRPLEDARPRSDFPSLRPQLFIIEGLATCVIAIAAVFVLPDFPHSTKFLSPDERALAIMRLVTADSNAPRLTHWQAFKAAVKDYRTWTCTLACESTVKGGDPRGDLD